MKRFSKETKEVAYFISASELLAILKAKYPELEPANKDCMTSQTSLGHQTLTSLRISFMKSEPSREEEI